MNLYPTVIRNTIQVIATVNFSHDNNNFEENEEKNTIDFAAILTGRELQEQDILDTALATFQSTNNRDDKNNNLKYSVKVTDTDKIKEIHIHTVKPPKKREIVAELYRSETPSKEVITGKIVEGQIRSHELKGPLSGKKTKDLIKKMEKGEIFVNISTEDKPKGKLLGKI
ncbi:MAG TPA: CHRD domain-containing protein, partial [Nitrososphaeraceae archaeon]|nr:CHRD domain-containing protein [Nitrososphaeraceae archaeon]